MNTPTGYIFPVQFQPNAAPQQPPQLPRQPIAEAQIDELTSRFNASRRATVQVGDIVREKGGVGLIRHALRHTTPLIVWRMLNPTSEIDLHIIRTGTNARVDSYDCLVGHLAPTDEGALELLFIPHSTFLLEPWSASETKKEPEGDVPRALSLDWLPNGLWGDLAYVEVSRRLRHLEESGQFAALSPSVRDELRALTLAIYPAETCLDR